MSADLLDQAANLLGRFVAFPSAEACDATALWVLHAHAMAAWESTPRLSVESAEKQSGKTRLLEVVELLVPDPMRAVNCSPSALFRSVAEHQPTVLFDEVDAIFGPKASNDHEDLRALINAGHRRGAEVFRVQPTGQRMELLRLPVFAAVALAGIGAPPETVADRAVRIRMRRRAPGEHVEQFRYRQVRPQAHQLRGRLAAWAADRLDRLGAAEPAMPPGIEDRPADVWEPLLAVAGEAGGAWPERARAAAVTLTKEGAKAEQSWGVRLLADIRDVFGWDPKSGNFKAGAPDRLPSAELAEKLAAIEESPWGDLRGKPIDARGLARRLRPYGIGPTQYRTGEKRRGYLAADFADAWNRYLPVPPGSGTTGTTGTAQVTATPSEQGCTDVPLVPAPEGKELDDDEALQLVLNAFPGAELVTPDDTDRAQL